MAPSLSTLPPEIFAQIVKNIPKNGHLLDLALCCHGFYDLVLPELYSHLFLNVDLLDDRRTHPKLRLLTRWILSSPTIASYVRSIILNQKRTYATSYTHDHDDHVTEINHNHNDYSHDVTRCLGASHQESTIQNAAKGDMLHIIHLPQDMSLINGNELLEEINCDNKYALMALLFQAVPNLQTMSIKIHPFHADILFDVFERAVTVRDHPKVYPPSQTSPYLQYDNSGAGKCGVSTNFPYCHIRLPAIREIYMSRISSFMFRADWSFLFGKLECGSCPTIEHLEFRDSVPEAEDLKDILAACSNLKTFVYDVRSTSHYSSRCCCLVDLQHHLLATANTLTDLRLDFWGGAPYSTFVREDLTPISSLVKFQKLKNLKVGMHVFFGVGMACWNQWGEEVITDSAVPNLGRILPKSLETLHFSHTRGRIGILTHALQKMLSVQQKDLPNLREITLEAYQAGIDQTSSVWQPDTKRDPFWTRGEAGVNL
ncbi:MAG: hypothetical protein L6R36_003739 [Xanthoria steineri]|nr:MAG: hypothetical protein L6R36_003739 [Xanthoria steineri]